MNAATISFFEQLFYGWAIETQENEGKRFPWDRWVKYSTSTLLADDYGDWLSDD